MNEKKTVNEWRQLLMNEDNCYWMKTTVNECRQLNEEDSKWMKTTVIEWRQLLLHKDDCFGMKLTVIEYEDKC